MPCNPLKCQCGQPFLPQRYVMVIIVSFGLMINFIQRENFGIIVGHFGISQTNLSDLKESACGGPIEEQFGKSFDEWQMLAQASLFGSFIIGLVIMMLPSGFIADKYGARKIFLISMSVSSLISGLYPFIVKNGFFWLVCTGRAFLGASSACVTTASVTLVSRWIPKSEQATVCGAIFTCVTVAMIGVHVDYIRDSKDLRWELVFHIWGGVGCVWCIFAALWLFSTPDTHPSMTSREKTYLEENLKQRFELPLDWVAIFLDPAIWALVAAQVGNAYIFCSLVTNITTYYTYALSVSLQDELFMILIPYMIVWPFAVLLGYLADFLVYYRGVKPIIFRKVYYGVATALPAIFIITVVFLECETLPIFISASLGIVFSALFYCSIIPNVLEVTNNYPGFVTGIMCMCGAIVLALKPFYFMYISKEKNSLTSWKVVGFVVAMNALFNTFIYSIMGSSKRRLWDMTQGEKDFYNEQRAKDEAAKAAANKDAPAAPPPKK
ncbi:putative inorganic phosphate cotransporter isoform X2 [Onthophagus taurus]|uniref:putative inorganic phosphate cotransporter isoform X2 n=1 Tax=Onthophagus taurus TaxID=166361 RepID=UPI000C20B484|nr:putative inorganic phosphate cotransporter isoform X2 [Onthophagus taurus]